MQTHPGTILACLIMVAATSRAAFGQPPVTFDNTDMQGTWVLTVLNIDEPNDPDVDAGHTILLDDMGAVTGGTVHGRPGLLVLGGDYSIDSDGSVTITIEISNGDVVVVNGASMSLSKDVIAGAGGGESLAGEEWDSHWVLIRQEQGSGFSGADMAGRWRYSEVNVDSGGAEIIGDIAVEFNGSGNVTGGAIEGAPAAFTGNYTISAIGEVSIILDPPDSSTVTFYPAVMNLGRNMIAGLGTAGTEKIHFVLVREAPAVDFADADMEGTWMFTDAWIEESGDIGSDGGILIEFDDTGNLTGGFIEPGLWFTGGTCDVASDGNVTVELSLSNGDTVWLDTGSMNSSKDIIAGVGSGLGGGESWTSHQVWIRKPVEGPCAGDTNDDGEIDVDDLNNVILDWGTDGSVNGGDITGPVPGSGPDGIVNVNDLNAVIVNWGVSPA